jgi:hypothetical protein
MRGISSPLTVSAYLFLVLIVATVRGLVLFSETRRKANRDAGENTGVLASPSAFEILDYETVGKTEQTAEERAKAIFNSVDIPR